MRDLGQPLSVVSGRNKTLSNLCLRIPVWLRYEWPSLSGNLSRPFEVTRPVMARAIRDGR